MAQPVKNPPTMREIWVWSLCWEDFLEKGTATHPSILTWRIPWTVQSMGLKRVGHNWTAFTSLDKFQSLPSPIMEPMLSQESCVFNVDPCISPKLLSAFYSTSVWGAMKTANSTLNNSRPQTSPYFPLLVSLRSSLLVNFPKNLRLFTKSKVVCK